MTDTTLYLCSEDHGCLGRGLPRFSIVDSAPLGEVASVRPEEQPERVTLLIKRPLKRKRWRLQLRSRQTAERLVTEVRRRIGTEDRDHSDDDDDFLQRSSAAFGSSVRASLPSAPAMFRRATAEKQKT